ncbi:hypothetical protein [[Phormidium] sp. ETS-05]|uniref:hypothetical protein n=1 Tax=[Phormidium] sp. ETS-05 TaxID=222819 RepID=UPI0018EF3508|nr:hypothetical protein [[Phormidium] sp. ETS-05]
MQVLPSDVKQIDYQVGYVGCAIEEIYPEVAGIFGWLFTEIKRETSAADDISYRISYNIYQEVLRICSQSDRIKTSHQVDVWAQNLAKHRLQQCFHYYRHGVKRGQIELHSTLSAMVYRYFMPGGGPTNHGWRQRAIEEFLQGFYEDSWNTFRRENHLSETYRARTRLEQAEYLAFTERYAKRNIGFRDKSSQQLIVLRVKTFLQKQRREISLDLELGDDETAMYSDSTTDEVYRLSAQMVMPVVTPPDPICANIIEELRSYLEKRQQSQCVSYFFLLLEDKTPKEIDTILGVKPRERDYLQQRFKYHLMRFAFKDSWQLVHEWLDADLDQHLGMNSQQWRVFEADLNEPLRRLLRLKQEGFSDGAIALQLKCSLKRVQRLWSDILERAWFIRNGLDYRTSA